MERNILLKGCEVRNSHIEIIWIFEILNKIFGKADAILKALEKCQKFVEENERKTEHGMQEIGKMNYLLPVLDYKKHKFGGGTELVYHYSKDSENIYYTYDMGFDAKFLINMPHITKAVKLIGSSSLSREVPITDYFIFDHLLQVGKILYDLEVIR